MRFVMRFTPLVIAVVVSGCAWLSDDEGIFVNTSDDYLDARQNPDLIIPEDLDQTRVQDPFPIPNVSDQVNANFFPGRAPRPDTIYASWWRRADSRSRTSGASIAPTGSSI